MLKVPDHQVAGHRADGGMLGPLVDDSGRFYKPLQSDQRGATEVAFYESFSSNAEIPGHIREFFPVFHGTQSIEASDGSGPQPHLVLEDLVAGRVNPSVMDIKMGSRTWYPEASEKYIQKCLEKDRDSTSVSLGFRISGLKVYQNSEAGFWQPDKKVVYSFNADGVRESALDGCADPKVKLVDFAHVVDGRGVIDHNFLGGLCSLIKFIRDIDDEDNKGANCQVKLGYEKS
ncbi:inositol polyphosphate multikinase beta-like isoform X2 [Syzygium oleosum]|uniref:inositol polyphosphate multikinase beta-like isoform X2 n=1 Tax=Syzygium oleosum TaxID=219896 RepID=UPI0024B9EADA|nr:inositol polyphosphate multikinase beta-like isoform X2 [Syzygium oleosum]